MPTPFRNDVDALKTRLSSLDEELANLRARSREYEALKERLESVEKEHAEVRSEIDARSKKAPAPYLDTLRIASPCHERWDDMIGDARTRFCPTCQKNVHNVSEMTRAEAETFLDAVAGPVCIRMYKRDDGTVMTADCPVGARRKRVKRLFLATLGSGIAAAAGAIAFWRYEEATKPEVMMGAMVAEPGPMMGKPEIDPPQGTATSTATQTFATPPDRTHLHMGVVPSKLPDEAPSTGVRVPSTKHPVPSAQPMHTAAPLPSSPTRKFD